jgi:hypothetical protein
MQLPAIQGVIRRRILVNFRVDPDVAQKLLPTPFRPKLLRGWAIAGICLIRLDQVRPSMVPLAIGQSSENAAHRFAVRWIDAFGEPREGVYIPRRDTNSLVNHILGGRLFPGEQHRARFDVREEDGVIDCAVQSHDGAVKVRLRAREAQALPPTSQFESLEQASSFFERGSVGYSPTRHPGKLDGVRLITKDWHVTPLSVDEVASSFFDDTDSFPPGSVTFDCALLMRNIQHEWQHVPSLEAACCEAAPTPSSAGLVGTV